MKTIIAIILTFAVGGISNLPIVAQTASPQVFDKVSMVIADGEKTKQVAVKIRLGETAMTIESKSGAVLKTMDYEDLKTAEYSYSKNPRWKTGLGLGAASLAFPPLLLVAIPLGFTKHRQHWLTINGTDEYAVLKLSKSVRKVFMPAFEVKSKINIAAQGEDK